MVVNPQTFNYRLIIGTLIIAILGLGAYSFSSYSKLKDQEAFLIQEKQIVESELSKIVSRYDVLMEENEGLRAELKIAREHTLKILDSFKYQKASLFILSKYRNQIKALNVERDRFIALANSLKEKNSQLQEERRTVAKKLKEQTDFNSELSQKNMLLAENLKKGSFITANSFQAKAYKTRSSGRLVETERARRTDVMEVCFTLAENALVDAGEKDLYVQILNPNSNIIGDKFSKSFGDYTLIYSTKTTVNYTNNVLDICIKAKAGEEEKVFTKGTYYVNVFNDENKLGSTKIVLN